MASLLKLYKSLKLNSNHNVIQIKRRVSTFCHESEKDLNLGKPTIKQVTAILRILIQQNIKYLQTPQQISTIQDKHAMGSDTHESAALCSFHLASVY